MRLWILIGLAALGAVPASASAADEVGRFRNDWTGNSIVVEAIPDPKRSEGTV